MVSSLTCPSEEELLAVAAGEGPSAELEQHLASCPGCQARLERLKAELALLREGKPEVHPPPPTASEPKPDLPPTNGQADQRDATAPWQSDGTADHHVSGPETDLGFAFREGVSDEPPLPASIGKYLVIGRFPPTGQAEVYRVVHPQLRQERVIKLAKRPVGEDGRSEIIEDGRILADLDHPNIVHVYELDFHEDRPYLVMESVRGRNLRDYAQERPPSPREAARLVAKVCAAVEFSHRRGIVHRDIKHLNILIDESNEPRLIDFGMARSRTFWSDEPARVGGSFAFMPPEQACFESPEEQQKVGPRSDVFSLGGVLYFLLTGKAPFGGANQREAWDRARRCDFDRAALGRRGIPPGLARVTLKAMAAEPEDRYATADGLADDLDAFLRRPRRLAILAGLLLAAALGSVGWSLWPARRAAHERPPLRVEAFDVELHRRQPPASLGRIGPDVTEARYQDDDVRIHARLSAPAYCYLIALNPDGKAELCHPGSPDIPPRPTSELSYPTDAGIGFGLTDGVGLQAFVLVASNQPLPAYAAWTRGGLPWGRAPGSGVYRYDGASFEGDASRGTLRKLADVPQELAATCRTLQSRPGADVIRVLAFPVRPGPAGGMP